MRLSPFVTSVWSWTVVGAIALLLLGGWFNFMTSGHPFIADGFLLAAVLLLLSKFITWEEAKSHSRLTIPLGCLGPLLLSVAGVWANHYLNPSRVPVTETDKTLNPAQIAEAARIGAREGAQKALGESAMNSKTAPTDHRLKRESTTDDFSPIFKDHPLFTESRKARARAELISFRAYMRSIGFSLPSGAPAFSITSKSNPGSTFAPTLPERWSSLGVDSGHVDQPSFYVDAYSDFLVSKTVGYQTGTADSGLNFYAVFLLESYFTASFLNAEKELHSPIPHWEKPVWEIRSRIGITTSDMIFVNTVYAIRDHPTGPDHGPLDEWLYRRIKEGNSVTDNDGSRWLEIDQIIRSHIHL